MIKSVIRKKLSPKNNCAYTIEKNGDAIGSVAVYVPGGPFYVIRVYGKGGRAFSDLDDVVDRLSKGFTLTERRTFG